MSDQQNQRVPSQYHVTAYYSEQETAEYSRLELQVIHYLTEAGVISNVQVVGEEQRHYNAADLALLRRVRRLYQDMGINLEGIEIIVRLAARIETLQHEVARYQAMAERSAGEQRTEDKALDHPGREEYQP
jgi:DNA-binding transcriptional MerR regulator